MEYYLLLQVFAARGLEFLKIFFFNLQLNPHIVEYQSFIIRNHIQCFMVDKHPPYRQLRTRRALSLFNDVPLTTRRALSLYKVCGNSALLVLTRTSLHSINALLVLSRWYALWKWKFDWNKVLLSLICYFWLANDMRKRRRNKTSFSNTPVRQALFHFKLSLRCLLKAKECLRT